MNVGDSDDDSVIEEVEEEDIGNPHSSTQNVKRQSDEAASQVDTINTRRTTQKSVAGKTAKAVSSMIVNPLLSH